MARGGKPWIGKPYTVLTMTVAVMGSPLRKVFGQKRTSRGQPRAWCKACEARVVLSDGTAYYGLEADPAIFETAVRGIGGRQFDPRDGTHRQVDKDTVCAWLHRVACHCRTVLLYFWHDLHVSECQLDELWSFVHTKEAHLPGPE